MALFRYSTAELREGIRKALLANRSVAESAMKDVSRLLLKEARLRTPVDEGLLTGAVAAETVPYRKSVAAVVYVPVNSPAAAYAIPMHEHDYEPGAKSKDKARKTGVVAGRKYLTRAIEENTGRIRECILLRMRQKGRKA